MGLIKRRMNRHEQAAIGLAACPKCGAEPGRPCSTPGYHMRPPHEGRQRSYKPGEVRKVDSWYRGYATALAGIHRGWHEKGLVKMAMQGDGVTIEQLRDNGVEDYDLREIERALGLRED